MSVSAWGVESEFEVGGGGDDFEDDEELGDVEGDDGDVVDELDMDDAVADGDGGVVEEPWDLAAAQAAGDAYLAASPEVRAGMWAAFSEGERSVLASFGLTGPLVATEAASFRPVTAEDPLFPRVVAKAESEVAAFRHFQAGSNALDLSDESIETMNGWLEVIDTYPPDHPARAEALQRMAHLAGQARREAAAAARPLGRQRRSREWVGPDGHQRREVVDVHGRREVTVGPKIDHRTWRPAEPEVVPLSEMTPEVFKAMSLSEQSKFMREHPDVFEGWLSESSRRMDDRMAARTKVRRG